MARPGAVRLESDTDRKKRPAWLWLLLALLAVAAVLLLLSQCGNNDDPDSTGTAAPDTSASVSATASAPSVTGTATAPSVSSSASATGEVGASPTGTDNPAGGTGAANDGTLTANGVALLPVATAGGTDGALIKFKDQAAAGKGVRVESVPADEGFWVGSSAKDRIYVQLTGTGESSYTVKAGDVVNFTGQVTANTAGFPAEVGVEAAEGADQLTTQGVHLLVQRSEIALDR